jgi:hypothetical protein
VREKNAFHDLEYARVEKLINEFFQRGVYGVQSLDVWTAGEMIRDLVEVVYFHRCVPTLFRIKDYVRAFLTGPKAHIGLYFHISEPFGIDPLLKFSHELLRAPTLAVYVLTDKANGFHKLLLAS